MTAPLPRCCAACGSTDGELVEIHDHLDRLLAILCRAGGRSYEAKAACFRKFLEQRPVQCVVCAEELSKQSERLRPVCEGCEATLQTLRKETGLQWYAIKPFRIFSVPDVETPHDDPLTDALRKILGGGRQTFVPGAKDLTGELRGFDNYTTGDIWARLTKDQAVGVVDLMAAFKAYVTQVAGTAHQVGSSLLVRLARGEVTIDDFNDGRDPARSKAKR